MSSYAVITTTTNSNVNENYEVQVIDAAGGNVTLTLPEIVEDGFTFILFRKDSGDNENIVTVASHTSDTISKVSSITLLNNQSKRIMSYLSTNDWLFI